VTGTVPNGLFAGVSLEKEARNIFGTPLTVAKWREQLQPRTASSLSKWPRPGSS